MNEKIGRFFDEQDLVEDDATELEDIDIDSMVETLNGFTFLVVGGREGFSNKIIERGWKGVTQVNTTSNSSLSNVDSYDFVVIATKFVSHNLVRKVESIYKDYSDRVIYFNGTNFELLVQCVFNFLDNYVNDK